MGKDNIKKVSADLKHQTGHIYFVNIKPKPTSLLNL